MGSIHIIKGMACVVSSTTFNLWFSINKKVQKICLYISLCFKFQVNAVVLVADPKQAEN